ncbi:MULTISPECIES: TIGR04255 family protein [unclassified Bradyrhizobium]|uniref:TIGR04255 family protein n=1 Tax=unclassified Bradyrhizobium TaxID=2631580 RepID=UPI0028F00EF2|nr:MULTISPECIES: TIGR04255 family protein [unclassified Bradyrhizobium]
MGKKMNNAPVYFALAQVRFNRLAALDTYIPAIQEDLRRAGYPDFATLQMAHLEMTGVTLPKTTVATRHLFKNRSQTAGFVLDQSWMTFQTTDYDTFGPFLSAIALGLETLHKQAVLSYSERVGIRFLDAVLPRKEESVADYLQSAVLGLSSSFPDRKLEHTLSETRTSLDRSTLVSRAVVISQKEGMVAFPEDLQPVQFTPTERFANVSGQYAIIDTDSWIEDRRDFDLSNLEATLRSLHSSLGRSFELMVTPHALKVWD